MAITWLADVLRAAGVTVIEHSGWKTHDRPGPWEPRFIVVHATAAPRTQTDADQVRIVRDGRSDLTGPIANACIDRQGRWHVLSAGRCNTTLAGTAGPYEGLGNTNALGIEACNDNGLRSPAEPWPPVQYASYVRGVAAICKRFGWGAGRAVGHREHTPGRKTDPTFSMTKFRADVTAALAAPRLEEDPMSQADVIAALQSDAGKAALETGALLGVHEALTRGASRVDATGRQVGDAVQAIVAAGPLAQKVDLLAATLLQLDVDTDALQAKLNEIDQEAEAAADYLQRGVEELPERVTEALGAGQSPAEVADILRAIPGTDWEAVARALLGP